MLQATESVPGVVFCSTSMLYDPDVYCGELALWCCVVG
jgi:hypothetical protein